MATSTFSGERTRTLGPRGALVLLVLSCAFAVAYIGYAWTRVPAVVLERDDHGVTTLTRTRWVGASTTKALTGDVRLLVEPEGRRGCRAFVRTATGEDEIGSWSRASLCAGGRDSVAAAERALARPGPFRAEVPVTGSQIWWPLPVVLSYLVLLARHRRLLASEPS